MTPHRLLLFCYCLRAGRFCLPWALGCFCSTDRSVLCCLALACFLDPSPDSNHRHSVVHSAPLPTRPRLLICICSAGSYRGPTSVLILTRVNIKTWPCSRLLRPKLHWPCLGPGHVRKLPARKSLRDGSAGKLRVLAGTAGI